MQTSKEARNDMLRKQRTWLLYREESLQICYFNDLQHSHIFSSVQDAHTKPLFHNRANVLNHFYENICIYIALQWLLRAHNLQACTVISVLLQPLQHSPTDDSSVWRTTTDVVFMRQTFARLVLVESFRSPGESKTLLPLEGAFQPQAVWHMQMLHTETGFCCYI